jgi:putative acetyltransferase
VKLRTATSSVGVVLFKQRRNWGITLMRLEKGISQPGALALFEACGFTRCGAFGDYPEDDPYSVFMERRLI